MGRGLWWTVYYMEIGTAEDLVALHRWNPDSGTTRPSGVEIISGWASDEPYREIARDVALQRLGEGIWVVIWTDGTGRGEAHRALAIAESELHGDPELAARRGRRFLNALWSAEVEREGRRSAALRAALNKDDRPEQRPLPRQATTSPAPRYSDSRSSVQHPTRPTVQASRELQEIWAAVTDLLNEQVLSQQRRAFLRLATLQEIVQGSTALLGVPDAYTRDMIETQLRPAIAEAFSRHLGRPIQVVAVVTPPGDSPPDALNAPTAAVAAVPVPPQSGKDVASNACRGERHGSSREGSGLNPRYTFESFVVGHSNRFPQAAAVAVAESPGQAYNPLFLYGAPPEQRTHLLHAIGHYALALHGQIVVRYVRADGFVREFQESQRDGSTDSFRRFYGDVDMLLIDDIQFLTESQPAQEEFFHIFNALHNANKQIVITSDRKPKDLSTLEDRLRTRFEWGLLADIQPPELETRIAILQRKSAAERMGIPPEVLEFIATRITDSTRQLEGGLIRVTAFASLNRAVVDLALAEEALRDFLPDGSGPEITAERIMDVSADYFGVSVDELRGHSRSRALVNARQVAMYVCRELTDLPLPRIGQAFGGRDHTTVMHADRKIRQQMSERRTLFNQITELTNRIKYPQQS